MAHKNGVTLKSESDARGIMFHELPEVVGLHSTLLQSPLFVLSEVTAKKVRQLISRWREIEGGKNITY